MKPVKSENAADVVFGKSNEGHKVVRLGYALSICFLSLHAALLVLFFAYGVTPMGYFNIFSVAFYLLSFILVKKRLLWLYSVSVHLEVVTHMFLTISLIGFNSGFQITLIGLNAIIFYAEYASINHKLRRVPAVALSIISMGVYIVGYIIYRVTPDLYELPDEVNFWMQILWGAFVFVVSGVFLKLFVSSTIRSERTLHILKALTEAIDAKDTYTKGHSGRVAKYSREIAKRAGMSEKDQRHIYMMGLLHDVGKIGVPDAIINKPGILTKEEYEIIKTHAATGARILDKIEDMPGISVGAHYHHERIDGKGYPEGLKGDEIPVEARVIAVADAYDAMTSKRSYRDNMPQSRVREEIEKGFGTQFDPRFGKIMIEMIDEDKEFRMREDEDGQ